jgi:uncharacterized protein YegJ (DUF2314 family)
VNDWLYVKGEETVGGFTMIAIQEIMEDRSRNGTDDTSKE